ncbi:hypothetical protein WMO13_07645 [Ignatzschineria larvae DSM 13226]|uniref:Lipoprotein n=1 Tax=Ignatzschineria larvae DSM 13226 TaxID=1111732 RepID=A0ABZ3BYS6_9GAMM|nr:hypothetical protein [Ignatzschineria larvae]
MKKLFITLLLPVVVASCASQQKVVPMPLENYTDAALLEAAFRECYSKGYLSDSIVQSNLSDLYAHLNLWSFDKAEMRKAYTKVGDSFVNRINTGDCQSLAAYSPQIISQIGNVNMGNQQMPLFSKPYVSDRNPNDMSLQMTCYNMEGEIVSCY